VKGLHPTTWMSTLSAFYAPRPASISDSALLSRGASASLANGERVHLLDMVVFEYQGSRRMGRVEEILMNLSSKQVVGVLLQPHMAGHIVMPYRFSRVEVNWAASPVVVTLDVSYHSLFVFPCLSYHIGDSVQRTCYTQLCRKRMPANTNPYTPSRAAHC
jgi:sporulation protein YlmC with PRC-barrel domain